MRRALLMGSLVVAVIRSLVAMPSAIASTPMRERYFIQPTSFVFPAGEGCPYATRIDVRYSFGSVTQFDDGRSVFTDHADFTITNIETGARYREHTQATFTDTFTPDGDILDVLDGRYVIRFGVGDQGPEGEVGPGGASYILVGHFEATIDATSGRVTSFVADGRAIDLCQLLGA